MLQCNQFIFEHYFSQSIIYKEENKKNQCSNCVYKVRVFDRKAAISNKNVIVVIIASVESVICLNVSISAFRAKYCNKLNVKLCSFHVLNIIYFHVFTNVEFNFHLFD